MKKNFFCKLLLFAALSFFISCQTDDTQTIINESASGITFKKISFEDFKKNRKAFDELEKINSGTSKRIVTIL